MIARFLAAAVTVVVAVALFVLAWPQLFRLEWSYPVAQAVSFRALGIALAASVLLILLVLAAVWRRARRFAGSLAVVFLAFSAIGLAVLSLRGFGNDVVAEAGQGDITVLAWNTLGDAPGAEAIAELALSAEADVLALPETTAATGTRVAELMTEAGRPMTALTSSFDQVSKARSTTLLISADLGAYTRQVDRGDTSVLPTVIATPDDGTGPTLVAVHPVAPLPAEMENWRGDLDWLASMCSDNTILAGDFNATLDHLSRLAEFPGANFGACTDAAAATGNGAVGTWPTDIPALLGTPIDHVMATSQWEATSARVIHRADDLGSDHRPVLAHLTPAS
jgi:endonuclease/exonuclease/phosphatase (EEP) superfamily protein YafD